jgi:hypothetical protein
MRKKIEYRIIVEQDDIPVRGNALASGDKQSDRAAEDEILQRLAQGDVWAWARVRVEARFGSHVGFDCLGACSYADAAAFKRDGYYRDMKAVALADLRRRIAEATASAAEFLVAEAK